MASSGSEPPTDQPPPRAFTQGVGTVFQFVGVTTFLVFFFICCFSSLLSRDTATHSSLTTVGWGSYTAQRAVSICMVIGVVLGMSLSGIGLGLQAQRRPAPAMAVVTCSIATVFWLVHTVFFAATGSILLSLLSAILFIVFGGLLVLSIGAQQEMRRNPPPADLEILPLDYKMPYSHYHEDPPEVRMARELEQRRQKLAVQQKELEMLEQKLHRQQKERQQ